LRRYAISSLAAPIFAAKTDEGFPTRQQKIKPLIAQRFPLAEARRAQELLGKGDVTHKIVLVANTPIRR
jgi:D-arabinose 1-dehydrogenase-like Zn-dependent alcohol dehydrogenase